MSNRKQRDQNRENARMLERKFGRKRNCPACGQPGSHFAPPSMGEPGFYHCTPGIKLDKPDAPRQPKTLLMSEVQDPASFSPSPDSGVVEQWENEGGGSPVDLSMPPVGEVVDSVATTGTNPPSGAFVGHDEEWQVKHWIDLGHSEHCAARLVYGDGICECGHGRAHA